MKRKLGYTLGIIASILLILVLLVTAVEFVAFDRNFYAQEFVTLGRAKAIGISGDNLAKVTDKLLSYMEGSDDSLSIKVKIGGKSREVFNKKEKQHMVDVKNLWLFWRDFRNVAACAVVFFALLVPILMRRDTLKTYSRSFLIAFGVVGGIVLCLGIWVSIDFNSFWTLFHMLFFTNELWVLNPSTDVLIMMLPAQFFFDIIVRILSVFGTAVAVIAGASAAYNIVRGIKRRRLLVVGAPDTPGEKDE